MPDLRDALTRPLGRRGVALLGMAVALAAFLASLVQLRDPDTFHLLAMGREIWRRGGLPPSEPFLFPFSGIATGTPSWLASGALFLSHRLGGDAGPVFLAALLSALLFALLFADSREGPATPPALLAALVPLALALATWRPRVAPRPEAFAYVLLAATLLALRRLEAGRPRLLFLFPLAALLWANLHQSVLAGVGVVAVWVAFALVHWLVHPASAPSWRAIALAAGLGTAGLAAALANPGGRQTVLEGLRFAASGLAAEAPGPDGAAAADPYALLRRYVVELGPVPTEDWLGPFGALLAIAAISLGAGFGPGTPREAVTVAGAAALAVTAWRYEPLAAIVAAPVAARHLARAIARLPATTAFRGGAAAASLAALAAAAWSAAAQPDVRFGAGLRAEAYPSRGASYLAAAGFRGRLYDSFHLGGYLEWFLDGPVFQDGRGILRPEDAEAAFLDTGHYQSFAALDARYRFDALLVARPPISAGLAELLARNGPDRDIAAPRDTWALVAFDDAGLLYLRRDGAHAAEAFRDEYRLALPANPFTPERLRDPERARAIVAEEERSVSEAPACRRCRLALGLSLLTAGRPDEAARALRPALGGPRDVEYVVLEALGDAALAQGDAAAARSWHRRVLALGIGDGAWSRRSLARLALGDGDLDEAARLVEENLKLDPSSAPDLGLARTIAARRARPP